jgi:hypothetical protein
MLKMVDCARAWPQKKIIINMSNCANRILFLTVILRLSKVVNIVSHPAAKPSDAAGASH